MRSVPRPPRVVATLALAASISGSGTACARTDAGAALEDIRAVLDRHVDEWMQVPGVEGAGIGLCGETPCIVVYATREDRQIMDAIPDSAGGHAVELRVTSRFEAQDSMLNDRPGQP